MDISLTLHNDDDGPDLDGIATQTNSRRASPPGIFLIEAVDDHLQPRQAMRSRSISVGSTVAFSEPPDAADADAYSEEPSGLAAMGSPLTFGPLSDRYASLSISHQGPMDQSLPPLPALPTAHSVFLNAEANASQTHLPATDVPVQHRRSRPSFSGSPQLAQPALSGHASRHALSTSSSSSSAIGSPPSIAASSGMVHKASLSSSAPSHKIAITCKTCGKKYKSHNCLAKHLWEHTEHWKQTSKFSISKHQQVQILEAASVLIGFTAPAPIPTPAPGVLTDHRSAMTKSARTQRVTSFGSHFSVSLGDVTASSTIVDLASLAKTSPTSSADADLSVGADPTIDDNDAANLAEEDDDNDDAATNVDAASTDDLCLPDAPASDDLSHVWQKYSTAVSSLAT